MLFTRLFYSETCKRQLTVFCVQDGGKLIISWPNHAAEPERIDGAATVMAA